MRDGLDFETEWIDTRLSQTSARIAVHVAGKNASRCDNRWSRSVENAPHLDAMPLALWLGSSWWRLRWEGRPLTGDKPASWRMAHEVAAAGEGFLWPNLTFISDGETLQVECQPSDYESVSMLRYIAGFESIISASAFEVAVDQFMELVIERADGRSPILKSLWDDVLTERFDPTLGMQRRFEAMSGFDPDEAPDSLINSFDELTASAGLEATAEIAAVCNGPDSEFKVREIISLPSDVQGTTGRFDPALLGASFSVAEALLSMYETEATAESTVNRGRFAAHAVREKIGLDPHLMISDRYLAEILGLTESQLNTDMIATRPPVGLMILEENNSAQYVFRKVQHSTSRRFEAARIACEGVIPTSDTWHPVTDAYTARQKVQRAFAAEFLIPIDGLTSYLSGDYSEDAVIGAAEYYDVSAYAAVSQLINHRVIERNHPLLRMLNA